jgi:hypothetical protein
VGGRSGLGGTWGCIEREIGRRSRIKIKIKIEIRIGIGSGSRRGGRGRTWGLVEGGEVGGAKVADFAAEVEVDADEFVAVDPGEVAFGNGGFDVGLDFGQAGQVLFARGEGLFVEGFEVNGAEGADVRGELAVPLDECALRDADVVGDAREAEAFGAEFGELIFNIVAMHGTSFRIVGAKDQTLHWLYWLYWLFLHREGRRGVAVHSPQSTVHSRQSTVHSPQSTVHGPQSTVHSPRSTLIAVPGCSRWLSPFDSSMPFSPSLHRSGCSARASRQQAVIRLADAPPPSAPSFPALACLPTGSLFLRGQAKKQARRWPGPN